MADAGWLNVLLFLPVAGAALLLAVPPGRGNAIRSLTLVVILGRDVPTGVAAGAADGEGGAGRVRVATGRGMGAADWPSPGTRIYTSKNATQITRITATAISATSSVSHDGS